ncbi:TRM32 protein [Nymphaea thermarum]|nr:TRM32 protein [Nymphaea thermarum]
MKQKMMDRHHVRREKHQPGCVWGLLRIFDFHRGHSVQKLISDRRLRDGANAIIGTQYPRGLNFSSSYKKEKGSYSSVDNVMEWKELDETWMSKANADQIYQAPVKPHMYDEISEDNGEGHFSPAVLERKNHSKKHQKQKFKIPRIVHNLQLGDRGTSRLKKHVFIYNSKSMERFIGTLDQATPLQGFSDIDVCQVSKLEQEKTDYAYHGIKDKLDEATEALVNQKLYMAQCLSKDGRGQHSKEVMDALEILNLNKELFIKLLHDPNSLLAKHIQGLRNAEMEKMSKMESNKPLDASELLGDTVDQIFSNHNEKKFCGRGHNSWGRNQSLTKGHGSQNSTQIIVLKPGLPNINVSLSPSTSPQSHFDMRQQVGKKLTAPFSLKEFKRKLKHAILDAKAEQHHVSMDGAPHRFFHGYQGFKEVNSGSAKRHLGCESSDLHKRTTRWVQSERRTEKRSLISKGIIVDELSSPRGFNCLENKNIPYPCSFSQPRDSASTGEFQKLLSEIINVTDADEPFSSRPPTTTLGRLLSLPECSVLYPPFSPQRGTSDEVQASSCHKHLGPECESECRIPAKEDLEEPVVQIEAGGPSRGLEIGNLEEGTCSERIESPIGNKSRKEPADAEQKISETKLSHPAEPDHMEEQSGGSHVLRISYSSQQTEEIVNLECLTLVDEVSSEDIAVSSPCIPSDCEASNPSVLSENVCEKHQQPSPVSVLEADFTEDFSSPEICVPVPQDVPIKPRKIHFEEVEYSQRMEGLSDRDGMLATASLSRMATGSCLQLKGVDYEYVRMLLEASNLTADMELDPCWDSINQPLHPSIFLLVDPSSEVSVDQLLLFDCVNEVLLEILERSFGFCELVSFSRLNIRPFPIGERLLEEVWAGINSHLAIHSNESPTLDHIVGRDLAKSNKWMDHRLDTGSIGEEIEVWLLEDLIEEAVTDLGR